MARKKNIDQFLTTAIGSSGPIATMVILVDKAIVLVREIQNNRDLLAENGRRIRNIVAQLQMALNYKEGTNVAGLFAIYEYIYEEISVGDIQALKSSESLLLQLRQTLLEVKKKIIQEGV